MGSAAPCPSTVSLWTQRVDRARELAKRYPAAAPLLEFYAEVLSVQAKIAQDARPLADPNSSLRSQIDLAFAARWFPKILTSAETQGPAPVAVRAAELHCAGETVWREVLSSSSEESGLDWFFARACLQPIAECLQTQFSASTDESATKCPACGGLPQLVILRPEGEGARRSLQCSFCLREWTFRRVLCAYCGEVDRDKLPYYTAEDCRTVRVEACDTCRHYLKSIDLSLDGLAVPLVDEVALSALDLWASEQGYVKVSRNLTGF